LTVPEGDPMQQHRAGEQLWLELPPMSPSAPRRLLVFLHGAGSTPEAFAPVALAWQLKFPGAVVAILQALEPASEAPNRNWYDPAGISADHAPRIAAAADEVARRIAALQASCGVGGDRTTVVGFSQGATVALELARRSPERLAIVVAHAGRLARPVREGESISATVHLIHGELDTLMPVEHSKRSFRHLRAAGADVSLDIAADTGHAIDQSLVTLGTTRVLQTLFRGRSRKPPFPQPPSPETLQ